MISPIKKLVNKHVADSTRLAKKFPAKAAMTYGTNLEESLKDAYAQGVNKNQWRLENNPNMDLSKYGEKGEKAYIQSLKMGKFDDDIKADFNRVVKRRGNQLRYNEVGVKGSKLTEPMRDFPNSMVTNRQIEKTRDRYFGGDERSGSPAQQTLGTNTTGGGAARGGHAFHTPRKYSEKQKEQMKKDLLNPKKWAEAGKTMYNDIIKPAGTYLLDWNDDGKLHPLEIGLSFVPGTAFVKGAKYLNKARKFLSPFKHCDSEMMHSGGWGEVRKYNSPGTTGNKEGIKHNEKMREEIGTFKMPHKSPFNKGHEVNKDSIAAAKAWKEHKAGYLKKPNGQKEYDMEKGEFYYSPKHGKLRLIPTDDGEVQDKSGIEKWQLAPDRKSSKSPLNQMSEADKRRFEREQDEPGETQFFNKRKSIEPLTPKPETAEDRRYERAEDYLDGETQTKYKRVINEAILQKANAAQISNKLRETFPEVKNNSVEVNWSPDGSEVEVYNMTPNATEEESKAVRDKFDATYLKGRGPFQKKKEGKKDACYHKVKSRVKVWPSAYASGQLVQCRKAGAANWGNKSKKK